MAARLLNETDRRVREKIETNIEQSGDQTLHQELAPKASLDNRLLKRSLFFRDDAGGSARSQFLQIDFDDHGDLVDLRDSFSSCKRIFLTEPISTPLNFTGAPTRKPIHRIVEVEDEFSGLPKQSSRTEGNHRDHQ